MLSFCLASRIKKPSSNNCGLRTAKCIRRKVTGFFNCALGTTRPVLQGSAISQLVISLFPSLTSVIAKFPSRQSICEAQESSGCLEATKITMEYIFSDLNAASASKMANVSAGITNSVDASTHGHVLSKGYQRSSPSPEEISTQEVIGKSHPTLSWKPFLTRF